VGEYDRMLWAVTIGQSSILGSLVLQSSLSSRRCPSEAMHVKVQNIRRKADVDSTRMFGVGSCHCKHDTSTKAWRLPDLTSRQSIIHYRDLDLQ
jgi:hypothetical protein